MRQLGRAGVRSRRHALDAHFPHIALHPLAIDQMAFLGLVPTQASSGETRRKGGISKIGNAHVRQALTQSAQTYRYAPPCRAWWVAASLSVAPGKRHSVRPVGSGNSACMSGCAGLWPDVASTKPSRPSRGSSVAAFGRSRFGYGAKRLPSARPRRSSPGQRKPAPARVALCRKRTEYAREPPTSPCGRNPWDSKPAPKE